MEVREKLVKLHEVKGSMKKFLTNKYVLGGIALGTLTEGVHIIKDVTTTSIGGNVLYGNVVDAMSKATFIGMPIGEPLAKLLGLSFGGIMVGHIFQVYFEYRAKPENIWAIVIREGVALIVLIVGLHFFGNLALNMYQNVSNFQFKL